MESENVVKVVEAQAEELETATIRASEPEMIEAPASEPALVEA